MPQPTRNDRRLVLSVHDVTPRHFEALRAIDAMLAELGVGSRYSMLVVPDFWSAWPLEDHPDFTEWLRGREAAGVEMILHGYYHRDDRSHRGSSSRLRARLMTAGEGEFLGLGYADAAERIRAGRTMLDSVLANPVEGFVAPAWLYSEATKNVLRDQGFEFAEDHWSVWSPSQNDRTVFRSPVISYSSRTRTKVATSWLWSRASTLVLGRSRVVRQAIHPHDLDSRAIVAELRRALTSMLGRRRLVQYRELAAL